MGKKTKVGKQRKDKYYQLAKETGYRSRAAFKLIQLNRKFGFLQKSRVCIDLCAAPGGWMQVAHQNMPLSSVVIGVDLFPIKPVPGCIGLTQDITTDKCKTAISKEIKTWKADVVLHDGAPNVGLNWLHDAYQQATLTLSALKLSTHFLREGGWFVTKVFRSKDYHSLIWVFKQLFKKVHATKPQASRNESSEIFVVCQGYIAPDSLDPKFLDAKHVFEDYELMSKAKLNILHPEKQKKAKAEGYEDNDYTQHHQVPVSEFLNKEDPIDALRGCSQIVFDDKTIEDHPKTTPEIKECCMDIKVLGRKDLKSLLAWMKQIKEWKKEQEGTEEKKEAETSVAEEKKDEDDADDEEEKVESQIAEIAEEERRQSKRKRKQLNKQRQRLAEKMNLKMVIKGDDGPIMESNDMFQLKDIKNKKQMESIIDQQPDIVAEESADSDDELKVKAKYIKYDVEGTRLDSSGSYYKDSDSDLEIDSDEEVDDNKEGLGFSDDEEEAKKLAKITKQNTMKNAVKHAPPKADKVNPLLTDLDNSEPRTRREAKAEMWFQKDSFKDLDEDDDEDIDLDKLANTYKKKGKKVSENALSNTEAKQNGVSKKRKRTDVSSSEESDTSSDSDYDMEEVAVSTKAANKAEKKLAKIEAKAGAGAKTSSKDTFEIVKQDDDLKRLKKTLKMDEQTLALGTMIATSKKFKRDLKDDAWNRYMFEDKNLPDWFQEDEQKNMRKQVEVPEEIAEEYKNRLQDVNVRPIKKVIEAKARKKKRLVRKLDRAKKRVEAVMENEDMSEREKAQQVRHLYKKARSEGDKKITYVVSKKHMSAKRARRPPGVKGRYKVVDPRQKKDLRAMKSKEKTVGRGKKAKGGKGGKQSRPDKASRPRPETPRPAKGGKQTRGKPGKKNGKSK